MADATGASSSSTDIGRLVEAGAFTEGLSDLHKHVGKIDMKQAVENLRATEATTGVSDKQAPTSSVFDNSAVDQDRYIAELIAAKRRIESLEQTVAMYRSELDVLKELVGKDRHLVEKDLQEAYRQCDDTMVNLLRRP